MKHIVELLELLVYGTGTAVGILLVMANGGARILGSIIIALCFSEVYKQFQRDRKDDA